MTGRCDDHGSTYVCQMMVCVVKANIDFGVVVDKSSEGTVPDDLNDD